MKSVTISVAHKRSKIRGRLPDEALDFPFQPEQMASIFDLTGQKFGRLKVLKIANRTKKGSA